jgi:hypothetical protein
MCFDKIIIRVFYSRKSFCGANLATIEPLPGMYPGAARGINSVPAKTALGQKPFIQVRLTL